MNCKLILTDLDDFLDDELKPSHHAQMLAHLGECDSCHQVWQQELQFRQILKEQDVPTPALGLEERVFAKLPQESKKSNKNAFIAGFSGAMAAGIMIIVVATMFFSPVVQQPLPNITLTLHESKKVKMVFDVPEKVANATFSLKVPSHIAIAGKPGLHQIEWKTALKKGKNLLSLPIVANAAKSGVLVAEIRYGDQIKTFRMKLDINALEQGLLKVVTVGVV